jgi:polyphosphate kinase 2 (PPK2 family)
MGFDCLTRDGCADTVPSALRHLPVLAAPPTQSGRVRRHVVVRIPRIVCFPNEDNMSKKFVPAVLGRDYVVKPNGTVVVARQMDILAPHRNEAVPDILGVIDHSSRLGKRAYTEELAEEEHQFRRLSFDHLVNSDYSLVVGLIGYDGAGKTGAISKLYEGIGKNSKVYQAVPYGKPDPMEMRYPYFKRFFDHERFPQKGQIRALDRFWCERMLVERVKKLAPIEDLNRSYAEINAMEWMLTNNKVILVKFWMDITRGEQNKRFEDRARDAREKLS